MNIVYKGNTITVNKKSPLGIGGEAVVIKQKNLAFKIYHTPSADRTKKLKAFLKTGFSLPQNIACPLDLVYNTNKKVIGFAMKVVKKCKDFMKLSNKKFRYNEQITTNDIIDIFLHAKKTLDTIHTQDIIIGDLNDMNILFNTDSQSVFIDVDSYQFEDFPCPVGTDIFLDPALYGIDLSKKPYFTKETDWYSFAVMIFKSLLFVYPYGGIHKKIKNPFERIEKRITVFDTDVIYPKVGLPPESLSDSLLEYFEDIFKNGNRNDLGIQELEKHKGNFIPCPQCGLYFFKGRKKCPACFKVKPESSVDLSTIVLKKKVDKEICSAEELFTSEGIILFVKVLDNRIIIVDYDYTQTVLHIINAHDHKKVKLWDKHIKNLFFDFVDTYLIVASGSDLMLFSCQGETAFPETKTSTLCFDTEPVFGTSRESIYRLTTTDLMNGHILNSEIVEIPVLSILENQTWLRFSQDDCGLGFFRILEKYHYFIFSEKGRFELTTDPLEGRIIEHEILFSRKSACLLRKNLDKGRTYSHIHIFSNTGELLFQRSKASISSDVLQSISGKAFSGNYLIHPTDAGIVVEKNGDLSLKSNTQEYVSSNSQLYIYKNGIITVNDKNILFLRMG